MTTRSFPVPLRGIVPPVVTPLTSSETLDVEGLGRLLDHLIAGGVHGLFVLGTTGEGPTLDRNIRKQMIERVCERMAGRLPILVGVTDTSLGESIDLSRFACSAGADAVACAPPCYFPSEQPDLTRYMTRLAKESPLPVVLYNMPALTKTSFAPETVRKLTHERNIIGIKDSSGDLDYFSQVKSAIASRPDWTLMSGTEALLGASIALGGTGGVCGGANVAPQLFVGLYEAAVAGESIVVERFEAQADRLGQLYEVGDNPALSVIQGVKAALAELDICQPFLAPPYQPLSAADRERVRAIVTSLFAADGVDRIARVFR